MTKLFVYGSLKKGERLDFYLKNMNFLGECSIKGDLYVSGTDKNHLVTITLPKRDSPKKEIKKFDDIKGEVYEVNRDRFDMIRNIEGAYQKRNIKTDFGEAFVFHIPKTYLGDWIRFKNDSWTGINRT